MNVLQRTILLIVGLLLVITSLPYAVHEELYYQVNQNLITINLIFGSLIGVYNFAKIFKRANTIHVIVDDSFKENINERESFKC